MTFGRRSFYNEVRASEFQKNKLEFPVRQVPERSILIRVELKNFLSFITQGINFIQPLNTFQDDQDRHGWATSFELKTSKRSEKRWRIMQGESSKQPPPPSPPREQPPPPSPPRQPPPAISRGERVESEEEGSVREPRPKESQKKRMLQFLSPDPADGDDYDSDATSEGELDEIDEGDNGFFDDLSAAELKRANANALQVWETDPPEAPWIEREKKRIFVRQSYKVIRYQLKAEMKILHRFEKNRMGQRTEEVRMERARLKEDITVTQQQLWDLERLFQFLSPETRTAP